MEEQSFHYFGSTALNWATGATREEVIKKLAREAGRAVIAKNVHAHGGLYCWTVKVNLPESAQYEIDFYKPVGVPMESAEECDIIGAAGKTRPCR